jgi:hypothetical protein
MLLMAKAGTSPVVVHLERAERSIRHVDQHRELVRKEVKESLGVRKLQREKNDYLVCEESLWNLLKII